jgi:predicted RNA-binding protein with RPS1 domain
MQKTNKEKNQQHERDQLMRVRPKQPAYDFKPLEDVIKQWITATK